MAAASDMRVKVNIPSLCAEVGEVGDGRFRAGNKDEVSVSRQRAVGVEAG